jgi:acetyl-CoA carboxylase biotin carboxylase subunit
LFKKILIANRGEIAIRVMRACREMGVANVGVYSDADRPAPHVRYADEVYNIGPPPASESYLNIDKIIDVARRSGAEAIHPGYGFLAENADFAEACREAGFPFVGPSPETLRAAGDKQGARATMAAAGIPVIPGSPPELRQDEDIARAAGEIGWPVMIKAAAGGGGKGMRICARAGDFPELLKQARGEARSAFGDDTVYVEKCIAKPRHVEFQILADAQGNVVHLFERECSIQRRHQKLIEESPSPVLDDGLRARMAEAAVTAARAANYTNAGTIEFLLDAGRNFYFLEVNARLQVEHPVTELVTGVDLVKEQLRIAAGEALRFTQKDIRHRGAAIECRISAEDPANNFYPATGTISRLRLPSGPGVRFDGGIAQGYEVPIYYDPLIAKLVTWAESRPLAIERMHRALNEFVLDGVATTIPFHRWVMASEAFREGDFDTSFVAEYFRPEAARVEELEKAAAVLCTLLTHFREGAAPAAGAPSRDGALAVDPWRLAARREGVGSD